MSCRKDAKFNWITGEDKSTPAEGAVKFFLREMKSIVEI